VHPLLAIDPRLSVSLIEDENVYAEMPVINGDLATGISTRVFPRKCYHIGFRRGLWLILRLRLGVRRTLTLALLQKLGQAVSHSRSLR
jgi:hypothetical protein